MSLSCECDFDPEPGMVCWYTPNDFTTYEAAHATCCVSCGEKIKPGDDVGKFLRYKVPEGHIERAIYGEDGEVPRAPKYHCERCAGLFFSLDELGYCISLQDDMRVLVKEYAEQHDIGNAA